MNKTLKVLRSRVPEGGFGRELTSTEVRAIRAANPGTRISNRAIVIQNRADYLGIVYNPQEGGFAHTGILVETMK